MYEKKAERKLPQTLFVCAEVISRLLRRADGSKKSSPLSLSLAASARRGTRNHARMDPHGHPNLCRYPCIHLHGTYSDSEVFYLPICRSPSVCTSIQQRGSTYRRYIQTYRHTHTHKERRGLLPERLQFSTKGLLKKRKKERQTTLTERKRERKKSTRFFPARRRRKKEEENDFPSLSS